MMLIIHNVLPVFVVIALGNVLGRREVIPQGFFMASDRLVYFVFFPVLLFWKIGEAGSAAGLEWALALIVLFAVFSAYVVSLVYARASKMPDYQVGSFSQCSFRFSSYVGLAVVMSALGENGLRVFGVVIGLAIPFINVLAVSTLIWFSESSYSLGEKVRLVLKAMLANPLILACLAGIAYSHLDAPFPPFFENTFRLLSVAALPLALLSIGNSLTLARFKGYLAPALVSSVIKNAFLPFFGYVLLSSFGFSGLAFQVGMLYFAMPTSPAAFILSSQLGSDPDLASACTVSSTLFSLFSLSIVTLLWL